MTRAEILESYKVRNGLIVSPGRFEGEPVYVPALWDMVCDGASDDTFYSDETPVDVFHVDADLRKDWPEIDASIVTIWLWQSEQGFIETRTFEDPAEEQSERERAEETEPCVECGEEHSPDEMCEEDEREEPARDLDSYRGPDGVLGNDFRDGRDA